MKGITLFASGGIGDLAFKGAGINMILANEYVYERAQVFAYNYPDCEVIIGDITQEKDNIISRTKELLNGDSLDFLVATPPCQGMSKNGRGTLLNLIRKGERPKFDPRNQLIVPTIEIIQKLLPDTVVFENVPEMKDTFIEIGSDIVNIIDFVTEELTKLGYVGKAEVVEFANYGVPERRQRLITIFSKQKNLVDFFNIYKSFIPEPTHSQYPNNSLRPWATVRDVISNLPTLDAISKDLAEDKDLPFHRVPVLDEEKYYWISNTPAESGAFDNQCVNCGSKDNKTHGSKKNADGINKSNEDTPIRCYNCGELLPRPWVKKNNEYRLMKGYTSSYRRMKWDMPANALTTNLSYACSDSKIHPEQNRVLSLKEAFIIHTIDDYEYFWTRNDNKKVSDKLIREIIGESIPPKGLEKIVKHLVSIYNNEKNLKLKPKQLDLF